MRSLCASMTEFVGSSVALERSVPLRALVGPAATLEPPRGGFSAAAPLAGSPACPLGATWSWSEAGGVASPVSVPTSSTFDDLFRALALAASLRAGGLLGLPWTRPRGLAALGGAFWLLSAVLRPWVIPGPCSAVLFAEERVRMLKLLLVCVCVEGGVGAHLPAQRRTMLDLFDALPDRGRGTRFPRGSLRQPAFSPRGEVMGATPFL